MLDPTGVPKHPGTEQEFSIAAQQVRDAGVAGWGRTEPGAAMDVLRLRRANTARTIVSRSGRLVPPP